MVNLTDRDQPVTCEPTEVEGGHVDNRRRRSFPGVLRPLQAAVLRPVGPPADQAGTG